jgi:hypothetical protein
MSDYTTHASRPLSIEGFRYLNRVLLNSADLRARCNGHFFSLHHDAAKQYDPTLAAKMQAVEVAFKDLDNYVLALAEPQQTLLEKISGMRKV